jgi:hypothetical protein
MLLSARIVITTESRSFLGVVATLFLVVVIGELAVLLPNFLFWYLVQQNTTVGWCFRILPLGMWC